jgi:tetratricopeptide (TPR) repeat protein
MEDFTMWERYNVGGQQAMTQGRWADAERDFKLALAEAEKGGAKDPHLPTSLNALANCYRQQGRFAEAEPLYKRALEVKTAQVGPFSSELIPIYENYAKMLRASGKEQEAGKLDRKAQAIFSKK